MPFFCQLIPEPIGGGEGEEIGQHSGFFRQLKFIKTLSSGGKSLAERQTAAVSSLRFSSLLLAALSLFTNLSADLELLQLLVLLLLLLLVLLPGPLVRTSLAT